MNEQIKELAEQCYRHYSEHNIDLEKFAQLIVRECAELFDKNEQSELGYRIGDRIYKHFEIK